MAEPRPGEPEVMEPMVKGPSGHGDAESVHDREVRQAELAGRVRLSEDHLPIGTMTCPPVTDPSLQGAADARIQVGMTPHQFQEHAHRADVGTVPQHRHDFFVEHPGQRIGAPPAARRPLLRGGTRILPDPVSRGGAEAGLRGRRFGRMRFPVVHESPRLVIGCVQTRHLALLFSRSFAR